ncbi:unnamed protein product [Knipowitschia caucasica]
MDANQKMPHSSNSNVCSWVSICPRGLWRVQLRQIHKNATNNDAGRHQCPRMGSICQVRVQAESRADTHSEDGAFTQCPSTVLQLPLGEWTTVTMGEGQCDITEACLDCMSCGDKWEIQLFPLGTGPDVKADSDQPFNATVELGEFTPGKESWELSLEEKFCWVKSLKQKGTHLFKNGDVWCAADSYSRALKLLITLYGQTRREKTLEPVSEESSESLVPSAKEYTTFKAELHSNLSLCQLKLKQPEQAKASATKATELDPGGAKAWYRLGQACQMLNELEEAKRAFKKLLKIQPDSSAAVKALKDVAIKEKESNKELAQRLSKMFG